MKQKENHTRRILNLFCEIKYSFALSRKQLSQFLQEDLSPYLLVHCRSKQIKFVMWNVGC